MCCLETYFFFLFQAARLFFVLKTVRPSCLFWHLVLHICGENIANLGRPQIQRDNVWRQRVKNSTMQSFSMPKIVQEGLTTHGLDFYLTFFLSRYMYCIQHYILTELLNFYLSVSSHLPTGQLSNVPWRRTGVKYTHNEVPSFAVMKNTVFTE